jgi:hypothetical protein
MLKRPFCPCCEKPLPLHFLWSAGLRARPCPHCDKGLRLKKSKSFVLAFTAIVVSGYPGIIITGHHLLVTFGISFLLFGGLALMVAAVSAGFREESDATSLNL